MGFKDGDRVIAREYTDPVGYGLNNQAPGDRVGTFLYIKDDDPVWCVCIDDDGVKFWPFLSQLEEFIPLRGVDKGGR